MTMNPYRQREDAMAELCRQAELLDEQVAGWNAAADVLENALPVDAALKDTFITIAVQIRVQAEVHARTAQARRERITTLAAAQRAAKEAT